MAAVFGGTAIQAVFLGCCSQGFVGPGSLSVSFVPPRMPTKQAESVWELAPASHSERVAVVAQAVVAQDEAHVELWDTKSYRRLSRFRVQYDCGGQRLALNPDGSRIVTAAYRAGKVTCYDSSSGESVWNVKLRRCQTLAFSRDGKHVFAGLNSASMKRFDAETGEYTLEMPGVEQIFPARLTPHVVEKGAELVLFGPRGRKLAVLGEGLGVAHVAFSKRLLVLSRYCFSEDTKPNVECVHLDSGKQAWFSESTDGGAFLELAWNAPRRVFLAYQFAGPKPGCGRIVSLSPMTGAIKTLAECAPRIASVFTAQGDRLIQSTGEVIRIAGARQIAQMAFCRS